jgi:formylglycine-generating enzyme required for sulfatase activity
MHGNVFEFCLPHELNIINNEVILINCNHQSYKNYYKRLCGGNWRFPLEYCRSAHRYLVRSFGEYGLTSSHDYAMVGFRVLCEVQIS